MEQQVITDGLHTAKYTIDPVTGCWNTRTTTNNGLTITRMIKGVRLTTHAHRLSYKVAFGPLPDGMAIVRTCRNNACICPQHLEMRENIGKPPNNATKDPMDSIKYTIDSETQCWNVIGKTTKDGYLPVCRSRDGKVRTLYAHRLMYEAAKGPIPPGLHICHTCDNPRCVNPMHLWAGTNYDNVMDKCKKGRASKTNLTLDQVKMIIRKRKWGKGDTTRLAKQLGVPRTVIYGVAAGITWKWVRRELGGIYLVPCYSSRNKARIEYPQQGEQS